jgi:hypothetical protein
MMTLLRTPGPVARHERPRFGPQWFEGAVGALAVALGMWLLYGPADGRIGILGWSWDVVELSEAWAFAAIIGGALLLAGAFTQASRKFQTMALATPSFTCSLLTLASLVTAVIYASIWAF